MAGLVPAIHVLLSCEDVNARHKGPARRPWRDAPDMPLSPAGIARRHVDWGADVVCRQVQSARRIQPTAHRLRCVLHPAYRRQVHRAGDAEVLHRRRLQATGRLEYLAGAIEIVLTIGLVFGLYTRIIGAISVVHLLVAAAAMYKLNRCWLWVIGGIEFCIFWALCCLVVAMHG
jgi:DoxX